MNIGNLKKLAEGILTIPDDQFEMRAYQEIVNVDVFTEKLPKEAAKVAAVYQGDIRGESPSPTRDIAILKQDCGTSGCALGWAPTFLAPPNPSEDWEEYAERVFGVSLMHDDEWNYMFGMDWTWSYDTPKDAANRIMFVVENGRVPEYWSYDKPFRDTMNNTKG